MSWTRRDFLASAGLAATAATLPLPAFSAPFAPFSYDGPAYLQGDRYLATAPEPGLKGRSFEEARKFAFRLRTPVEQRDRFVLGLPETLHA
jgi:hypothetical protein